jgi:hypothetical protein
MTDTFWPGTNIKRSFDNGFTLPAGPSVMTPVRTDRQLAADESRRNFFLVADNKPRKTVAQLLAPARNQISIPGQAESAKTARIKRVKF